MKDTMELDPEVLESIADIIQKYCNVQSLTLNEYLHKVESLSSEWRDDKTFGSMIDAIATLRRQIENILVEIASVYPRYFKEQANKIRTRRAMTPHMPRKPISPPHVSSAKTPIGSGYTGGNYYYAGPYNSSFGGTTSDSSSAYNEPKREEISTQSVPVAAAKMSSAPINDMETRILVKNALRKEFPNVKNRELLDYLFQSLENVKIVNSKKNYYDPDGVTISRHGPVIGVNFDGDFSYSLTNLVAEHVFYTSPLRDELIQAIKIEARYGGEAALRYFAEKTYVPENETEGTIMKGKDYQNALSFFKQAFRERKSHQANNFGLFAESYSIFEKMINE